MAAPPARKFCAAPIHVGPRWMLAVYFRPHRRAPDGSVQNLQSYCNACDRILARDKTARKRGKHSAYKQRSIGRRNRQAQLIAQKAYYRNRMNRIIQPDDDTAPTRAWSVLRWIDSVLDGKPNISEAYQAYLETERLRRYDERRKRGVPERNYSRHATSRAVKPARGRQVDTLPNAPLRDAIRRLWHWPNGEPRSRSRLARQAGVSLTLIDRILYEDARVTIDAVDKIAYAMGTHIDEIYDYEEAA